MQHDKKTNVVLLLYPIPIKALPDVTKFLCSTIAPSIKESDCSDGWKYFPRHCENGSSQIQVVEFYKSYSPVEHAESFGINISNAAKHRLTARILYVIISFHNTNFPIHERVCVSKPPYYIYWFNPMFLSIEMTVHFFFNARMVFREKNSGMTMA